MHCSNWKWRKQVYKRFKTFPIAAQGDPFLDASDYSTLVDIDTIDHEAVILPCTYVFHCISTYCTSDAGKPENLKNCIQIKDVFTKRLQKISYWQDTSSLRQCFCLLLPSTDVKLSHLWYLMVHPITTHTKYRDTSFNPTKISTRLW